MKDMKNQSLTNQLGRLREMKFTNPCLKSASNPKLRSMFHRPSQKVTKVKFDKWKFGNNLINEEDQNLVKRTRSRAKNVRPEYTMASSPLKRSSSQVYSEEGIRQPNPQWFQFQTRQKFDKVLNSEIVSLMRPVTKNRYSGINFVSPAIVSHLPHSKPKLIFSQLRLLLQSELTNFPNEIIEEENRDTDKSSSSTSGASKSIFLNSESTRKNFESSKYMSCENVDQADNHVQPFKHPGIPKPPRSLLAKISKQFQNKSNKNSTNPFFTNKRKGSYAQSNGINSINVQSTIVNNRNRECVHKDTSCRSPMISKNIYSNRNFLIVDCRFNYEYKKGHIKNSININSPLDAHKFINVHSELLKHKDVISELKQKQYPENFDLAKLYKLFFSKPAAKECIIIFYCEFSSQRAPNLYSLVRAIDREINKYPKLNQPNIFVLEGGYEKFNKLFPYLCTEMGGYLKMEDPEYSSQLNESQKNYRRQWSESGWKLNKF